MPEHTRRVLLIDDDPSIIKALSVRVDGAGYGVLMAADGTDGLAAAKCQHPDAIILDIRMCDMDGLTVLKKLREDAHTAAIPVIVLSASARDKREALARGARYFVDKPYDPRRLLIAIESLFDEPRPPGRSAEEQKEPAGETRPDK